MALPCLHYEVNQGSNTSPLLGVTIELLKKKKKRFMAHCLAMEVSAQYGTMSSKNDEQILEIKGKLRGNDNNSTHTYTIISQCMKYL